MHTSSIGYVTFNGTLTIIPSIYTRLLQYNKKRVILRSILNKIIGQLIALTLKSP